MIASPASDIFSFGIFIMDTTTDVIKAIDAANMFQHGEIPERAPNLSGEQWNLVVKMCAYEPQDRVDIAYVVSQLKIFAMECGNTSGAPDYETNTGSTEVRYASMLVYYNTFYEMCGTYSFVCFDAICCFDRTKILIWKNANIQERPTPSEANLNPSYQCSNFIPKRNG
jgi:hypothetical protein